MPAYKYENFQVERLEASGKVTPDVQKTAKQIQGILFSEWSRKLVPEYLSARDLREKINPSDSGKVLDQAVALATAGEEVHYWMSTTMEEDEAPVPTGILRVETYDPRNPFRRKYPNITDLEVIGGFDGDYAKHGAALLYHALENFKGWNYARRVATYIVNQDCESRQWFQQSEFEVRGNSPDETAGSSTVVYKHFEAPGAKYVREELEGIYPFLQNQDHV